MYEPRVAVKWRPQWESKIVKKMGNFSNSSKVDFLKTQFLSKYSLKIVFFQKIKVTCLQEEIFLKIQLKEPICYNIQKKSTDL